MWDFEVGTIPTMQASPGTKPALPVWLLHVLSGFSLGAPAPMQAKNMFHRLNGDTKLPLRSKHVCVCL